ncbi:MAG: DoxX family protein, partial [Acidobacteriota bacterium]|nr:DoxX family protein [Acidobacteriota bacterium]
VRWSRVRLVVVWILQLLVAAAFIRVGVSKLASSPPMVDLFAKIGLGQWFRYLTGTLEVAGGIGVLIPRLSLYAALLLVLVMLGAIVSQLVILGGSVRPALVLLLLASAVAWLRRSPNPA